MKKVNMYEYFMKLPQKENTKLSEFGKNLSGGQNKELVLLEHYIRNPKYFY